MELLGVTPGAVTVFGADQRYGGGAVKFVLDSALMAARADQRPSADQ